MPSPAEKSTPPAPAWHTLSPEEVVQRLQTNASTGLTPTEAHKRLERYGPNELQAAQTVSPWTILLAQFKNVLIIILLIGAGLSYLSEHALEAAAIAVIVFFAILLGFIQEFRAERAMEALQKMAAPLATALRDGHERQVPARQLVPGDVLLLHAGDRVPADARLLEAVNLQSEEAALTGESTPVEKQLDAVAGEQLAPGERKCMVFAGTAVTYGRGRAVVVATGMETEFGKVAEMLQTVERSETPLQQNLDKVGKALAVAALAVVLAIVVAGVLRGQPWLEMLVFGIALAVAVVPEALPAVVTISLAIGLQRMAKRHALVRSLPAVETLGSATVICSDKTGTLTKDSMTARRVFAAGETYAVSGAGYDPQGEFELEGAAAKPSPAALELLRGATLASDAYLEREEENGQWRLIGDPTEGALVVAAAKAGLVKQQLDEAFPRIGEIPFTSESKRMTTLHSTDRGEVAYAKGAPETILASCSRVRSSEGDLPLDDSQREAVLRIAHEMAQDALRVLAVATKQAAQLENAEQEMTFLGLIGMIDPPRPEAKEAIGKCEMAGVKVVMITGDHPVTAQAIAREVGLLGQGKSITGSELNDFDDARLSEEVEKIQVYSRVSPEHKLRIVTALQERGHIAAMTGDGVNDAPALKKADIGIAMGITGTDVSKEAAVMTLTDDNFASIVAAIEEGRAIFGNIKKYLMYLLSSNIGEIGLMAGATVAGLPLPLTAVQILYVNLATDGLPALALAVDPPEPDLMRRRPRDTRHGIFTRPVVFLMLLGGIWSTIINLGVFVWARQSGRDIDEAITMTFVSLVLIQFFKAYNFRSDRHSVLRRPLANKWLNIAIAWELVLLAVVVYWEPLHKPFGTYSLPWIDWAIVLGLAFTVSPVLEAAKWMVRRGWLGEID